MADIEEILPDTAVFVALIRNNQEEKKVLEYLNELEFLATTAGIEGYRHFVQKLDRANPRTYVGPGKIIEIINYVKENNIGYIIFDDELTPSQMRNIEKDSGVRVVDRTGLILDIFAQRAQTAYAKTQVELAQYQYLLPRLTGMWTHLERQRGGINMRGPGESQLETDRRIVLDKIKRLKLQLEKIDRQMISQRGNRGSMKRVALVGYTNVGKSTLMNILAKSEVFAENKLFATLDTTVRKVVLDNKPFLLSDTVGFIRKLPTQLVESFKSTLDEVREADLLLHVADISHPEVEDQIDVVNKTLEEIGVKDKKMVIIFNKIDSYQYEEYDEFSIDEKKISNYTLDEFKNYCRERYKNPCVFISAKEKNNIDELKRLLTQYINE